MLLIQPQEKRLERKQPTIVGQDDFGGSCAADSGIGRRSKLIRRYDISRERQNEDEMVGTARQRGRVGRGKASSSERGKVCQHKSVMGSIDFD